MLGCATSGLANLETGLAETQALISAKLIPILRLAEARPVTLWLPTFQVFSRRVYCAPLIPSQMTRQDKTRSPPESGSLGRSCPGQSGWCSEAATGHIILGRLGKPFIKTSSALHTQVFGLMSEQRTQTLR